MFNDFIKINEIDCISWFLQKQPEVERLKGNS